MVSRLFFPYTCAHVHAGLQDSLMQWALRIDLKEQKQWAGSINVRKRCLGRVDECNQVCEGIDGGLDG